VSHDGSGDGEGGNWMSWMGTPPERVDDAGAAEDNVPSEGIP
jgi:hypothetical protein